MILTITNVETAIPKKRTLITVITPFSCCGFRCIRPRQRSHYRCVNIRIRFYPFHGLITGTKKGEASIPFQQKKMIPNGCSHRTHRCASTGAIIMFRTLKRLHKNEHSELCQLVCSIYEVESSRVYEQPRHDRTLASLSVQRAFNQFKGQPL